MNEIVIVGTWREVDALEMWIQLERNDYIFSQI